MRPEARGWVIVRSTSNEDAIRLNREVLEYNGISPEWRSTLLCEIAWVRHELLRRRRAEAKSKIRGTR